LAVSRPAKVGETPATTNNGLVTSRKEMFWMHKLCSFLLVSLLLGCSATANQSRSAPETRKVPQAKEPGVDAAAAAAAEARGEKWQRVARKIGNDDFVRFALSAANQDPSQPPVRILLGCGNLPSLVIASPSSSGGNVRVAFDQAALVSQRWDWFPDYHYLGPPGGHPGEKKFLAQMMNSKTLRFDFKTKDGPPQLAVFNMLDIKDLVNQEPVCDFWLPPPR
jgi:hypothetical protein